MGTAAQPSLPALNATHIERLTESDELVTLDGEIVAISQADSDSIVAWMIVAQRIRAIARRMEDAASVEMLGRVRDSAGPITTEYAVAKESVSRGSMSGAASERIRAVLEAAAADGIVSWDVVDNVAPMRAHVTPAKAADYCEHIRETIPALSTELAGLLPEKRRSIRLDASA